MAIGWGGGGTQERVLNSTDMICYPSGKEDLEKREEPQMTLKILVWEIGTLLVRLGIYII